MKNLTKNLQFHPKQLLLFTAFAVLITAASIPEWGTFKNYAHLPYNNDGCHEKSKEITLYGLFNACPSTDTCANSPLKSVGSGPGYMPPKCADPNNPNVQYTNSAVMKGNCISIGMFLNQIEQSPNKKKHLEYLQVSQYSAIISISLLFILMGFLGNKKYANTIFVKVLYGLTILSAINTLVMFIMFSENTVTCVGAFGQMGGCSYPEKAKDKDGKVCGLDPKSNAPVILESMTGGPGFTLQIIGIILLLGSIAI